MKIKGYCKFVVPHMQPRPQDGAFRQLPKIGSRRTPFGERKCTRLKRFPSYRGSSKSLFHWLKNTVYFLFRKRSRDSELSSSLSFLLYHLLVYYILTAFGYNLLCLRDPIFTFPQTQMQLPIEISQ